MPKTKAAEEMDRLQARLAPFLQGHGFRTRSRTANRKTSDGLTHVINFQMGRFDPPGTSYIPWFRKNLYGRFTVNVGVYVPEVAVLCYGSKDLSFVQEVECCVRMRLAQLAGESVDRWWALPGDRKTDTDLKHRLETHAFPFLSRIENRDLLLRELDANPLIGGPASSMTRAIIFAARGQFEIAKALLKERIYASKDSGHVEFVKNLAEKIGIGKIEG
jgi:Domain of unknown function (DUF4304)